MKQRTLADGSLVVEERLTLLRWGAVLSALALVAILGTIVFERGRILPREAIGGGLGVIALMALAMLVADREFRFDRSVGRMRWTVRRLTRTRIGEVRFHEIEGVTLRSEINTEHPRRALRYTPLLETQGGSFPLSSFQSGDRQQWEDVAHAVAVVLGRPTESLRPLTVEDLVASGRVIEAIALARRERGLDLTAAKALVDSMRRPQRAA